MKTIKRLFVENGAAFIILAFAACKSTEPTVVSNCVLPPPTSTKNDLDISNKISASFAKISGSFENTFKRNLDVDYGKLNDRQVEYYMFFEAIECFSKDPKNQITQSMAKSLATLVLEKMRKDYGLAAETPGITRSDKSLMLRSRLGNSNLESFQKYGL